VKEWEKISAGGPESRVLVREKKAAAPQRAKPASRSGGPSWGGDPAEKAIVKEASHTEYLEQTDREREEVPVQKGPMKGPINSP